MSDPYRVLGVSRNAEQDEIKRAFKKLAREFHPDRNQAAGAEDQFKEVNRAYEILGDPKSRGLYDEFGEASLQTGFDPNAARFARGFGGDPYGGGINFGDFFSSFFTTGGNRTQQERWRAEPQQAPPPRPPPPPRRPGPLNGADIRASTTVDFLTALRGGEVSIIADRPKISTASRATTCPGCRGSGRQTIKQFGMEATIRCESCGGGGEVSGRPGTTETERVTLRVRVPAGVSDGQSVRLRGQGGKGQRGGRDGDLILEIRVKSDQRVRRDGQDLELDVPITILEAVRGGRIEVKTPSGTFRVVVPAATRSVTRLRLRGRGMPEMGDQPAGDLYLLLHPTLPKATGEEVEKAAEQLEALYEGSVRDGLEF